MPRGFHALIAAQFLSALADNALLIVTIAILLERQMAPWWAPLLKSGFTAAYVLLAPYVGPLADAVPKARLMAWMNGVKLAGVGAIATGLHPVAGYCIVGVGAAAYAPAKYGLITELVPGERLVAANGWIEVSVVCAALLGAVGGGLLVSPAWLGSAFVAGARDAGMGDGLVASLHALLAVYGVAALVNLGVADSGARYPAADPHPVRLARDFWRDNRLLWRDREGGLSLAATTLFWGAGATLQFVVLRWAAESLGLPLSQGAYLQGVVALGVVVGAVAAGRWVSLAAARHMLVFGVLLGLMLPVMAWVERVEYAVPLLVVVGAVGGLLVVPLNALLQHRGSSLLSAGRSIGVQGFNENASILAMLAAYAALVAAAVPLTALMCTFGGLLAGAITLLALRERCRDRCERVATSPAASVPRSGR